MSTELTIGEKRGSIVDFWRWAFTDLRSNNLRGIYAEWMVAQLLCVDTRNPRRSWDEFDLALPDGRTVEVKASAYLQSWHTPESRPSAIQFSGLRGRRYIESDRRFADAMTYNADIYVFCVQTELNGDLWNAFDLEQWDFYVVGRVALAQRGIRTAKLSTIRRLSAKHSSTELPDAVAACGQPSSNDERRAPAL